MDRNVSDAKIEKIASSVETMIGSGINADRAVELARGAYALTSEDMKVLFAVLKERGMKDIFTDKHF